MGELGGGAGGRKVFIGLQDGLKFLFFFKCFNLLQTLPPGKNTELERSQNYSKKI